MSLPEAPHIASSLIAACTTHTRELSKLPNKPSKYHYRAPLCHEFARFRLWTHSFDSAPPADDNVLDEVLEEAEYLKEPTVLLLASFASCLLDDCLRKVGNDYTRALLRLSLSEVFKAYPRFASALKRKWETPDTAIVELRECVDALFDVLSTLDNVMEEMKEDHVATAVKLVEPLMTGTNVLQMGTSFVTSQSIVGGNASVEGDSVAMAGSLARQPSSNIYCPLSIGGDKEDEGALEKVFMEEPVAHPASVMGSHWEIYQQYIQDRFPQAVGRLDIEGFAKGNVDCYDRLMRRRGDKGKQREAGEEEGEQKEVKEVKEDIGEVKEEQPVPETVEQSAHLPPLLEESAMQVQTGQQMLERMKHSPSAGVATTFKDSGLGSSAPHSLPPVSIHSPDSPPRVIIPRSIAIPANIFLAAPPSVSGLSQSTICSVSSEPGNRRLLPRVPEHSQYGSGFKCTFCGLNQRPTTQGHRWRKHVFADLTPYMCIRTCCPNSGTFYSSKKAWIAHDLACIRSPREAGGGRVPTTSECPFCLKGFGGDTGRFYSHVAHHMEDIRLFALPPSYREYEEKEYRDSSGSGSTDGAKSIVGAGEMSALGQYLAANRVVQVVSTKEWAVEARAMSGDKAGVFRGDTVSDVEDAVPSNATSEPHYTGTDEPVLADGKPIDPLLFRYDTTFDSDVGTTHMLSGRTEVWTDLGNIGSGAYGGIGLQQCLTPQDGRSLRVVKRIYRPYAPDLDLLKYLKVLIALGQHTHRFVEFYGWYQNIQSKYSFIAMEYLPQGSLDAYMENDPELARKNCKTIAQQALSALEIMHKHHICHRALNPRKVLIASLSPLRVKLTGFSLSKSIGSDKASFSTRVGVPGYTAPEIIGLLPGILRFTTAVDIWALGCIVYHIVTGSIPFYNDDNEDAFSTTREGLEGIPQTMNMEDLSNYCQGSADLSFPAPGGDATEYPPGFKHFICSVLSPEPDSRPSATVALRNPWLSKGEGASDVPFPHPLLPARLRGLRRKSISGIQDKGAPRTEEERLGLVRGDSRAGTLDDEREIGRYVDQSSDDSEEENERVQWLRRKEWGGGDDSSRGGGI